MTTKHSNGEYEILKLKIEHERELREMSEKNAALNLKTQSYENQLHFDALNHAHATALKDREELLRASVYETSQKEFQAWKLEIATILAAREASQTATQRIWGVAITVIAIIVQVVGIIISRSIR